jgi:hypothetical protein
MFDFNNEQFSLAAPDQEGGSTKDDDDDSGSVS